LNTLKRPEFLALSVNRLKAQCQPSNERALALAAFLLPLHL
jgi:hypothetical protein